MLSKNVKFISSQKDDTNSNFFRKPLIKRRKEYAHLFTNLHPEIKLRNKTTQKKIKENDYFILHHYFLCDSKCRPKCKYEDYKKKKFPKTPIKGLNCDKIDDYLFASQRLTNKLIKKYDLVNKFKELNLGLIVNCEEKYEHPCCGTPYDDGLDENGFAYSTIELEKNGVHVIFCGWADFIAPDSYMHMIKVLKKIYYYIHTLKKKILVHCHAGLGRTALALACYKIYEQKLDAEKARKEIRKGSRMMCLSGGKLFEYVQEFAEYFKNARENFFEKNKKDVAIFKINERILDVGNYKFCYFNDKNYIDNVPIFLLYIFDRIIQIKNEQKIDDKNMNNYLTLQDIKQQEEKIIEDVIKEINKYNWDIIYATKDIKILGNLLFKWLHNSINYVLNPKEIELINKEDYYSSYKTFKESTKQIFNCISTFLNLIKDNKGEKTDIFKDFLEIFIPSLLGYSLKETNDKIKVENIIKLNGMIEFINK